MMMKYLGCNLYCKSEYRDTGRKRIFWKIFPDTPGSLGIAISEAIEGLLSDPKGKTDDIPWALCLTM